MELKLPGAKFTGLCGGWGSQYVVSLKVFDQILNQNSERSAMTSKAITRNQHAHILEAYICRLSLWDVKGIVEAYQRCWQEQANGNAGSQDDAHKKLVDAIRSGIQNVLPSDLANICAITQQEYS